MKNEKSRRRQLPREQGPCYCALFTYNNGKKFPIYIPPSKTPHNFKAFNIFNSSLFGSGRIGIAVSPITAPRLAQTQWFRIHDKTTCTTKPRNLRLSQGCLMLYCSIQRRLDESISFKRMTSNSS